MILDIVNFIIWSIAILLSLTYFIMCFVKQNGETLGSQTFKVSILWMMTLLFIFLFKLPTFFIIILFLLTLLIVHFCGIYAQSWFIESLNKTKMYTEDDLTKIIMNRKVPRSEGLILTLVFQIILLTSSYFIYYGVDNLNFSRELTQEEKEIEQLECLQKYSKGKSKIEDSALIFFYCGEYYSKTGKEKKQAMCILEKAKDSKNNFTLVQGIKLCQKKINPVKK